MCKLMTKGVRVHDIHCELRSYKLKFLRKLVVLHNQNVEVKKTLSETNDEYKFPNTKQKAIAVKGFTQSTAENRIINKNIPANI